MAKLKRNIKLRHAAEASVELAETMAYEAGCRDGEERARFWAEVVKLAGAKLDGQNERQLWQNEDVVIATWRSMTDQEARAFGQQETMPFGEYAGMQVDAVPLDRLRWYADQTFVDDLRRYLESDRVKNEGSKS